MAKETAEKKLLKLIETTQAQEAVVANPAASAPATAPSVSPNEAQKVLDSVKGPGIPKLNLPPFLSPILSMFKGGGATLSAPGAFGLKDINKILLVGIVLVSGFLILSFLSGWNNINKGFNFPVQQMPDNTEAYAPSFRDVKEYVGAIARRNIFQPFELKQAQKESAVESVLAPINERTKDLRLVGISWLDTPESASAMIENTQSGVTYFLKSGEQINNVTVKQIFADSILISFGTEEMEMRL